MKKELRRVMVVDDNPDDIQIISRLLNRYHEGVEIDHAESGEAALIKLGSENHCIAFFDFRLPDMNGVELLQSIKERGHKTPVLMITGQGDEKAAVSAMKAGAYDYICKDELDLDLLSKAIFNVMEKKRLEEENERLQRELLLYTNNLEEMVRERTRQVEELNNFKELILSNLNDYIRVVDPHNKIIQYESLRIKETFGDGVGKTCYAFWKRDQECENCISLKAIEDGTTLTKEEGVDGKEYLVTAIPLSNRDGTISAIEVISDITERKRLEEERRQAQEKRRKRTKEIIRYQRTLLELAQMNDSNLGQELKRITEAASKALNVERVSVWFFNKEHTKIACEDLYTRGQNLHGKRPTLQAEDYPRYFRALEESRAIAASDACTDHRSREFSDGYLKPLGITSLLDVPIRLGGKVAGIVCHEHTGAMRRWNLEERDFAASIANLVSLAIATKEIDRNKRFAAMGEAVAHVAHEIRNPLTAIKNGAELLGESVNLDEDDEDCLKWISSGVANLEELVNDILDFSRPKRLIWTETNINSLIDEVVAEMANLINNEGRDIKIKTELSEEVIICRIDTMRIKSILNNLITNAIQAIKGSGEIKVLGALREKGDILDIKISDNGQGIPDEELPKLFEPFFTTKKRGTGLGMSIVKKFVEMHGGEMDINSRVGEGTEVSLTLPLRTENSGDNILNTR